MVLAATAIPIELRSPSLATWGFGVWPSDVLANVLGYVVVGIVLTDLGPIRAVIAAASLSMFAETAQLGMAHRDPSIVDVLANIAGAILGIAIAAHWKIHLPDLAVNRPRSRIAALLAVMLGVGIWLTSGDALNSRGLTSPGRLEGHWKLDESGGRVAEDSSGNGLDGSLSHEPKRAIGAAAPAILFEGADDSVDLGHSSSLRLVGSMTISAWVNAASFGEDDATILSSRNGSDLIAGYQLDASVRRGRHRVALKVVDECGRRVARFGATPLVASAWYHMAGVYDAEMRTMDVYLNGQADNGLLIGQAAGTQHASRSRVYIGRRGGRDGQPFGGLIRDVRIYSRALTRAEIATDMTGAVADGMVAEGGAGEGAPGATGEETRGVRAAERHHNSRAPCAIASDREDGEIPIAVAGLGLLAAVACLGLWPSGGGPLSLVVSFAAGFVLLLVASPTLPSINQWLFPLTSLAGAISVAVSVRSPVPQRVP
jgi:hypothetical protein